MSLACSPSICYFRLLPWWFSSFSLRLLWYRPGLPAYLLWSDNSWRAPSVSACFLWKSLSPVCPGTQTHPVVERGLSEEGWLHGKAPRTRHTRQSIGWRFWCWQNLTSLLLFSHSLSPTDSASGLWPSGLSCFALFWVTEGLGSGPEAQESSPCQWQPSSTHPVTYLLKTRSKLAFPTWENTSEFPEVAYVGPCSEILPTVEITEETGLGKIG